MVGRSWARFSGSRIAAPFAATVGFPMDLKSSSRIGVDQLARF
jgi:hypothetical protein